MASKVFSIGIELPGSPAEYIPFRSDRSMFDADVIAFWPSIESYSSYESYAGHRLVSESESVGLMRDLAHWRAELKAAIESGKTVFVFLPKVEEAYYHTGERSHSGTGRSRVTTQHVAPVHSYQCLPFRLQGLTARTGTEISPMGELGPFAAYWNEFGSSSEYQVYFDPAGVQPLLGTKKREKVVGALIPEKSGGALVLLPPIKWDDNSLTYTRGASTFWRKEAIALGRRLVGALVGASDARRRSSKRSPTPDWVLAPENRLDAEQRLLTEIARVDDSIRGLTERRKALDVSLEQSRELYDLLYESGKSLEHSIRLALTALGFEAAPYHEGDSEFDVVFSSREGRFLGEAEGKENKAVNVDKMSQLERNLQEDFARDEVTEFAKGVLFANAYRFLPISERQEFFTDKCVSAAKRLQVALVRTPDLFIVARYLVEHSDPEFAAACRRAIFAASGDTVNFPTVPSAPPAPN